MSYRYMYAAKTIIAEGLDVNENQMLRSRKKPAYGFRIHPGKENPDEFSYEFYIDPPPIRVISFKGGGSRVIVYTKFLEIAHEQGLLESVEEVGGSSSGCIASAFAAIHYEDPLRRTQTLDEISKVDKQDIYGKSPGWKVYQAVTSPLLLLSQIFAWSSQGINWAAIICNKTLPGKIIGIPLKIFSVLLRAVALITSPRTYVGIGNLITNGGIYRGDQFQECTREHLKRDTQAGIEAILSKLDASERERITAHLIRIHLCKLENKKLVVAADVTFRHLHELAQLPGSQFKEYYTTGFRKRDKKMLVFNHENTPDMPVYYAMRLAVTFPYYFQSKKYNGDRILDGGIENNGPVDLPPEKPVSRFKQEHGVTDKMARLNVRVEYPEEHHHHLWRKKPPKTRLGQSLHNLKRRIAKKIAAGVDVFATDEVTTARMQRDYAQRTLQLPDFEIGQLEKKTSERKRNEINDKLPEIVHEYLRNHDGEKVVIENYQDLQSMSAVKRAKLLKYLQNESIATSEIFKIPGKTAVELEVMRSDLKKLIEERGSHFDDQHPDTATIYCALNGKPEMKSVAETRVDFAKSGCKNAEYKKMEGSKECSVRQRKVQLLSNHM